MISGRHSQALQETDVMLTADAPLRAVVRTLVPPPIRAAYWQLHRRREFRRITSGQHYEPHVGGALKTHIRPGWTCADVGANAGLLSLLMAHLTGPTGRVVAFEPHPDTAARLTARAACHGYAERVQVVRAAVNDGSIGEVALYAGRGGRSPEWNIVGHDVDGRPTDAALTVPAVSLDAHFATDARVDLIKIDVEGAESQVLAGMQRILRESAPVLVIECHSDANWRACAALSEQGYALFDTHGSPLDPAAAHGPSHLVAVPA